MLTGPPIVGPDGLPPLGPLPPGLIPPPVPTPVPGRPINGTLDVPPAPAAPVYPKSNWDLLFAANGTLTSASFLGNAEAHGVAGGLSFGLTRFLSPVADDDAPRTLQPFLQRTSTLFGSFSFGGSSTTTQASSGGVLVTTRDVAKSVDVFGGPAIGADIYLIPELAITAGFSYTYDALTQASVQVGGLEFTDKFHRLTPSAGIAARFGDTRFDLTYTFEGDLDAGFGGLPPALWGTLTLTAFTVLDRKVALKATGSVFQAGAGGTGTVEFYPSKDLGLFAGGFGFDGREYFNTHNQHNDYGAFLGGGLWVAPRVRLVAEYQISGTSVLNQAGNGQYSILQNELLASLLARLP